MNTLIPFILGAILGGGVVHIAMMQQAWTVQSRRYKKIWRALEATGFITVDQAERLLETDREVAQAFLDTLQKRNQIKQIGNSGKYLLTQKK